MLRHCTIAFALVLTTATAQAAPKKEAAEQASDPADKMICKRFVETGSLVKGYRTCKTKRDWERERDALRQQNLSSGCNAAAGGRPCA